MNWGDGEVGRPLRARCGGRWGDGEVGKWGDGEMGKWGSV